MDTFKEYAATAAMVPAARAFVAGHFAGHPDMDDARLLASELAQNAVRHGDGTGFTVTVEHRAFEIRVAVANTSDTAPDFARSTLNNLDAVGGRGLAIMRALATCGIQVADRSVEIWFSFPTAAILPIAA